jgi:nucleotidyltransferase substrate binding protein (TIGR01987 family)
MTEKEFSIDTLKQSLKTLTECWTVYSQKKDDTTLEGIVADSCVKRFEYTMETALKLMRKYLKLAYGKDDKELTVNNIFRLMAGYEMITNWENWKLYYAKRNDTSHEYNIEKARELLTIIPQFIADTTFLVENFDIRLRENQHD